MARAKQGGSGPKRREYLVGRHLARVLHRHARLGRGQAVQLEAVALDAHRRRRRNRTPQESGVAEVRCEGPVTGRVEGLVAVDAGAEILMNPGQERPESHGPHRRMGGELAEDRAVGRGDFRFERRQRHRRRGVEVRAHEHRRLPGKSTHPAGKGRGIVRKVTNVCCGEPTHAGLGRSAVAVRFYRKRKRADDPGRDAELHQAAARVVPAAPIRLPTAHRGQHARAPRRCGRRRRLHRLHALLRIPPAAVVRRAPCSSG